MQAKLKLSIAKMKKVCHMGIKVCHLGTLSLFLLYSLLSLDSIFCHNYWIFPSPEQSGDGFNRQSLIY